MNKRGKDKDELRADDLQKPLDRMLGEAGATPVTDFEALLGGWPESELDDGFEDHNLKERKKDV